jgi:LacI family transcriptional regulator
MSGNVTVKDIAQQAAVSIGTVSRVLNQRAGVNGELRNRVLRAASELGYLGISGQNARLRAAPGLKEIGFLLAEHPAIAASDFIDPFWAQILHGVQTEARQHDIKVTYMGIGEIGAPQAVVAQLANSRLKALLVVGPAERDLVAALTDAGYLVVLVDNFTSSPAIDAVLSDGYAGAYEATSHLIAHGHREIACIGGPTISGGPGSNAIYSIALRASGYRSALIDAGLPIRDALYASCDLTPGGAYVACCELLDRGSAFTALFCANDKTAMGAIRALRERGRAIPHDCSVIGFDDVDFVQHLTPALTTVRVDREAMGRAAVRLLMARANDPADIGTTQVIRAKLVVRHSVAARP